MNDQPTDPNLAPADQPTALSGYLLGLLAGLGVAVAYGAAAEVLSLTFGLVAVGFFGGWAIGGAVSFGTWGGAAHATQRAQQVAAIAFAGAAWLLGLIVAYVISQAFLPQASTGLLERLTPTGFAAYLSGTFDALGLFHLVALVAATVMAWRGAR